MKVVSASPEVVTLLLVPTTKEPVEPPSTPETGATVKDSSSTGAAAPPVKV